jgi:hypothetical protein
MRHDPVSSLVHFLVASIRGPPSVFDRARKFIGWVEAAHVPDLFGYGDDLGSVVSHLNNPACQKRTALSKKLNIAQPAFHVPVIGLP